MTTDVRTPCCLVTGATGWVGRHVVRELLRRGYSVVTPVRAGEHATAEGRFAALCAFAGPGLLRMMPSTSLIELPPNVEYVIHCAALVDFVRETGIFEANVGLTWEVLLGASRLPRLRRLIHLSSLTIRTDSSVPFAEDMLDAGQRFVSPYALTKYLAESLIRKFHRPLSVTVVRTGTVLPPLAGEMISDQSWFFQTLKLWQRGRLTALPLAPDQHVYPVPVDVLAERIVAILLVADTPPVLHMPYEPGPTAEELFRLLSEAIGIAAPRLYGQHTPEWQEYHRRLPSLVRRAVDALYPVPPRGSRLACVSSEATREWFRVRGLAEPEIPLSYWAQLARSVARVTAAQQQLAPVSRLEEAS